MPYKIPWSNFHELNLDWLLEQVKLLRTDVDDMMGAATPSDVPPLADGTADAGTSINYSRGDHVHPTDTSRAAASALTTETLDRQDADLLLSGRIDTLSARVVPSDAYPLMDGAAESGSNVEYSRRDHRHPTDTSRAAASDLTQEITDRGNADITLQTNIDAVDAKIKFSAAAPLMNSSSASPGFSDYQARADHVHPTDTSRASQDDFNTLKARVDAFEGSANPSDATPLMDGVGAAGTGGNYSRGDHVHPSDTSKLDKAGGTITGDVKIEGNFLEDKLTKFASLTSLGWYRVITCPAVEGTLLKININRRGTVGVDMAQLVFAINSGAVSFYNQYTDGLSRIIPQIRYTSAGAIDIYVDQTEVSALGISIEKCAPTKTALDAIHAIAPESVANTPIGETIISTYDIQTTLDPFAMELLPNITTITPYNLTISNSSGFVQIKANKDNSLFNIAFRVAFTVTTRDGTQPGFMFDLPFTYQGPTGTYVMGRQTQSGEEYCFASFTKGSATVTVKTSETWSQVAAGDIRFLCSSTLIFNR